METSKIFNVLGTFTATLNISNAVATSHWREDRVARHYMIVSELGAGAVLGSFIVDTNHPNGLEVHTILSNGVILIQNKNTMRLVTELIARPGQIRRYWEKRGLAVPPSMRMVLDKARKNEMEGRNNW